MKNLLTSLSLVALAATPLTAQEYTAEENAIVVTAQRSGAPMWTIDTPTGTIILVGEIRAIPKTTPWEPVRLEEATKQADRVILGARPKVSPADLLRLQVHQAPRQDRGERISHARAMGAALRARHGA
jgi:uncharacterized protein YbaP (TraB family)